jgi:hypothetical protein
VVSFLMRLARAVIVFTWTSLFHSSGYTAYSNYNSVLIGNQAAGMGGAYTALYQDSSAVAFYNPAGLAFAAYGPGGRNSSASASATVYKKFDTKYGDLDQFTSASLRINQGFFRGVPTSSGSVLTYEKLNAAFSIIVPDYETFGGEIRSTDNSVSLLNFVDESLWVGGGAGLRLSDLSPELSSKIALGVSLYYTARNLSRTIRERIIKSGTEALVMSEEKNILGNSIVAILGIQSKNETESDGAWAWGISIRPPSLQINGTGSYFKSVLNTNPFSTVSENHSALTTLTKIPGKLTVGVAWFPKTDWTLSFDLSTYEQVSYRDMTDVGTSPDEISHRMIANLNFGLERPITRWLTLRMGAFTNFSSHAEPSESPQQRLGDRIDQLGWSANLGIETREHFIFTFGGYYTGGRGQSVQLLDQKLTRVPKSQQVFTMLVGTSFFF